MRAHVVTRAGGVDGQPHFTRRRHVVSSPIVEATLDVAVHVDPFCVNANFEASFSPNFIGSRVETRRLSSAVGQPDSAWLCTGYTAGKQSVQPPALTGCGRSTGARKCVNSLLRTLSSETLRPLGW
jgi:hypothetical protein